MADTLQPITDISDEWQDVYSAVGINGGTPLTLQNTGTATLLLIVSADQPENKAQGRHLYPLQIETLNVGNSGLWVKNSPKGVGLSRLQVDTIGGLDETGIGTNIFPDSMQLQIEPVTIPSGASVFIQVTNNTSASIVLEQIVNGEAIPTGVDEGFSAISLIFYFNPDLTGATILPSPSKVYANGYDGSFVDITGSGILLNTLADFDTAINNDAVRVLGGQVSYSLSNQALTASSVNNQVLFARPFSVAPRQSVVFEIRNTPIVTAGVEITATGLVSGRFLTLSTRVEILPENLTYEGDNLTYDGDQLTYT